MIWNGRVLGLQHCPPGRCSCPVTCLPDSLGSDLTLKPRGAGSRERIKGDILVHVNSLGMLPEVVESRESAGAVALEGTLSRMFSSVVHVSLLAIEIDRNSSGRTCLRSPAFRGACG